MRFIRIVIGYLAATYCASLAITLFLTATIGLNWSKTILMLFFAPYGMQISVEATIFQSALFIAISERFGIRTLPYYLGAGFLTGFTAILILPAGASFPLLKEDWFFYLIFAAAGAACGAVYWGIAGRKAGLPAQPAPGGE